MSYTRRHVKQETTNGGKFHFVVSDERIKVNKEKRGIHVCIFLSSFKNDIENKMNINIQRDNMKNKNIHIKVTESLVG